MWLLVILKNGFIRDYRVILVTKSFQVCARRRISMIIQVYNFYFTSDYYISFSFLLNSPFPFFFPSFLFWNLPSSSSSSSLAFSVIFSGGRNLLCLHVTVCVSLMDSVYLCFSVSLYLRFFHSFFFCKQLLSSYLRKTMYRGPRRYLGKTQKEGSAWLRILQCSGRVFKPRQLGDAHGKCVSSECGSKSLHPKPTCQNIFNMLKGQFIENQLAISQELLSFAWQE